jgi:hypothetical protein
MEAIGKLLEHLGYATPALYAAAAYGLFHWLDENTSDQANVAITSAMQSKGLNADRIVSALLEIFDQIYTHPLWSKRAFRRSVLFTVAASLVTLPTVNRLADMLQPRSTDSTDVPLTAFENSVLSIGFISLSLSVNILTDYVSLFYVRRRIRTAGDGPVVP